MGLSVTKYCLDTIGYYYIHLKISAPEKANLDSSLKNYPMEYPCWESLPYVALVEIYKALSAKDRFNVSLTCRAWGQPFSRPEVWRQVKFCFNGIEDRRAMRFAESLGSGLRHLSIDCQVGTDNVSSYQMGMTACDLGTFFDTLLNRGGCRLVTLRLINMDYMSQWFMTVKAWHFVKVLGHFLSTQTDLKVLDFTRAGFSTKKGIKILTQAASSSGSKITVLGINEMFSSIKAQLIIPCLKSFTSLKELTISYRYLCDDLLKHLGKSGSLNRLNVFVPNLKEFVDARTSSATWEELKRSRPSLEAHYYIDQNMICEGYLQQVMVPGIPLVAIEFACGFTAVFWYDIYVIVARTFKNYLRRLNVSIRPEYACEAFALIALFEECPLLEEVHITDRYNNLSTLKDLTEYFHKRLSRKNVIQFRIFTFNGLDVVCFPGPWKAERGIMSS